MIKGTEFVIDAVNAVERVVVGDEWFDAEEMSAEDLAAAKSEIICAVKSCTSLRASDAEMKRAATIARKICGSTVSENARKLINAMVEVKI